MIENFSQSVAEILGDSPGQRWPNTVNLRCQVSLERERAGRTEGLVVFDFELFAEPGMLFEAAARANYRADFQPGQASHYGHGQGVTTLGIGPDHRDRIAILLVDVQDMVERALNHRLDLCGTGHDSRIALPRKRVK